ncbi:MAG: phenylalanine--tRNA ligase subunit beta [Elusimicrobia bacterium]|nr:phenylalanine--tRNA ligase subunit beta [Elusimicrobiota bacterium]
MLLPLEWLKDYLDIDESAEKIADLLVSIGMEVESFKDTPTGKVFEIELTPNRGDCASVVGLARELAAALGKPFSIPEREIFEEGEPLSSIYNVSVDEPLFAPVYHLRLIRGVEVGESPDWLKERLLAAGQRPLNSVVDATNYLMLELNQPLHAFDADKIQGKTIIVRRGGEGEEFLALDGEKILLTPEDTVISGGGRPIALGGVVGGENSGVTDKTQNILLESAYFTPRVISATERRHGIKTEASYRFSRGTDPGGALKALDRAALMISELTGGKIAQGALSVDNMPLKGAKVEVKVPYINKPLGTDLKSSHIKKLLVPLEFTVREEDEETLFIEIPSFRGDVRRPSDIAEEVARTYGYDNIKSTLPTSSITTELLRQADPFKKSEQVLACSGYSQAVTLSLSSSKSALDAGMNERELVFVDNPINVNMDILKPSILFGLLEAAVYNVNQGRKDVSLFERGPIFRKGGENLYEREALGFLSATEDFFEIKKTVLTILEALRLDFTIDYPSGSPLFDSEASALIKISGGEIGAFGLLSENLMKTVPNAKKSFSGGYIILSELLKETNLDRKYVPWSPYPSVFRDISIVVNTSLTHSAIYDNIFQSGGRILKNIRLFDTFRNERIGEGKKSMSYELEFNSNDKTLTSEEVEVKMKIILENLEDSFDATLREL